MLGFYISYIMLGMQILLKSVFIKYQSNGEVKNNGKFEFGGEIL